ncbi:MAG: terminase small subunit [Aridibacter sp.]
MKERIKCDGQYKNGKPCRYFLPCRLHSEDFNSEDLLNDKQKLFVEYYIGDANFNATKSAKLAGYSEDSLTQIGYENLRKPHIKEYLDKRLDEEALTNLEIIHRLSEHARGSIFDVLDEKGRFNLDAPDSKKRLMKKIKVTANPATKSVKYEYEIYDAQAALDKLATIRGLKINKHELAGVDGKDLNFTFTLTGNSDISDND